MKRYECRVESSKRSHVHIRKQYVIPAPVHDKPPLVWKHQKRSPLVAEISVVSQVFRVAIRRRVSAKLRHFATQEEFG